MVWILLNRSQTNDSYQCCVDQLLPIYSYLMQIGYIIYLFSKNLYICIQNILGVCEFENLCPI